MPAIEIGFDTRAPGRVGGTRGSLGGSARGPGTARSSAAVGGRSHRAVRDRRVACSPASGYPSQSGRVIDEAALRARGAAADVDRYVRDRHQTLNAIAGLPAIVAGDPDQIRPVLVDLADARARLRHDHLVDRHQRARPGPQRRRHRPAARRQRPPAHPGRAGRAAGRELGRASARSTRPRSSPSSCPPTAADGRGQRRGRRAASASGRRAIAAESLRFAGGADVVIVDQAGQVIAGPRPVDGLEQVAAGFPLDRDAGRPGRRRAALRHGTVRGRRRAARLRAGPERRLARPRAAAGGGGVRPRDRGVRAPARR